MTPYFSIIVPMFNRAGFIERAIRSCLAQEFGDFEVIVVDDASTDGSIAAVGRFSDPRIRMARHERNRGRCPARNTGMAMARGSWFIFLDSDDELLLGALEVIHRRTEGARPEVGSLRFMCVDQRGPSPVPAHRDEVLDYEAFVRSLEPMLGSGRGEALPCSRAGTFPAIRYPDDHAPEGLYHLNMARHHLTQACSEIVRRYHHDAPDQITVPTVERMLRYAVADAENTSRVLTDHGTALRTWAPGTYRLMLASGALSSFLAGRRLDGLRYSAAILARRPLSGMAWARLGAGLLGPRTLAALQAAKSVARRRR